MVLYLLTAFEKNKNLKKKMINLYDGKSHLPNTYWNDE